jgi:hypothetical protein
MNRGPVPVPKTPLKTGFLTLVQVMREDAAQEAKRTTWSLMQDREVMGKVCR